MGKTLTAQNLALQLCYEKGYRIVPCSNVKDIKNRFKDNIRQVFFIDDIFGKYTANIKYIENWMRIEDFVKYILSKGLSKVLATCRTEIFKQENVQKVIKSFQKPFDLTGNYSSEDKVKIARKYLKENDRLLTDIVIKKEFSPLMCFLFTQHDVFDVNEFLNSPYNMFSDEWDKLKIFDREKLCVLLLCVINNGTITETNFDVTNNLEIKEEMKFKIIFDCCRLGRDTSLSAIKDKLDACVDTYFIKVDKEYKVIHDKMFDFLCDYFGKSLVAPILKFADDKLISERVQLESLQKPHGEFTIIISSTDEQKYLDRLKLDLKNGKIHWCLNNVQMRYKEYREKLLDVMKDIDDDVKRRCIDIKDDNGINAFIISCMRGYEEIVDLFISVGADVDAQNGWFTPLTAACREGHLRTVEILLDNGSNLNETNKNGETPIYTACFGGHYSLVKQLIDKHADMNKRNRYNRTPLYVCCLSGHESIARLLIEKGANVCECSDSLIVASHGGYDKIVENLILKEDCCINSVDTSGKTALFIACEEGYTRIVKLIIDNNADIFTVDNDGKTPLHAACYGGHNDIVRMLINKNADVNMLDVDLESPLHKACRKGSVDLIQTLLEYGADINHPNRDAHTPLHLAKTEGEIVDERILKPLGEDEIGPNKDSNVKENRKDKLQKQDTTSNLIRNGWTPLYEACVQGDIETFKSLIKNRANVNMQTNFGEMPLVAACQQGHGFLIKMLLEERADINQALYCAVQKDCDRAVKILLYKGGDLGYKGVDGKSLITLACKHGSIKAIKILSDQGADFTERDVNGRTLIHVACGTNSVELLQFLIDKGLDLNIPEKNGKFALFVSIYKGYYNVSEFLIENGCSIAILEEDTKTALLSVFEAGNKELSKLLVTYGHTEKLSNFNETMLYYACRLGLCDKVKMLLQNGTDINKRYKYGYTPMILADIGGNDDLSEYLQNHICFDNHTKSTLFSHESTRIGYIMETEDYAILNHDHIRRREHYETDYRLKELYQACISGEFKLHIYEMLYNEVQVNCFFSPNEPYVSTWFKQTPLCLACRKGHSEVVKILLKYGAKVDLTVEEDDFQEDDGLSLTIRYGYTPLFAACQRKYYEIVDMLLETGANLNKALYDACREGYLDTVQFLLQKGAQVNLIGRYGQTALYGACISGHYTIVEFLIDQGAVTDIKVQRANILNKKTCLHAAYLYGNHKIVQLLINRGASVDTVDSFGRTLLHKASRDGNDKIVKILVDKGVDINASDSYGSTPLIACVLQSIEDNHGEFYFHRKMEKYKLYEDFGQLHEDYPNQLYEHNDHFGSKYKILTENHYKVIQLLIENGADINKADKIDRTPLSLARKIGDMKLTEMLLPQKRLPIEENNVQGWNQVSIKRSRRNFKKSKH
ncbi:serine/threonine-protein phosphatase 6 regulatory ankyrin repeat subunit A-like [Mytilus californianus]|uniref:serine/threonine-protein phosphatase 6 regulatory ankyrin repeat subunit A-like n=1 Tax=Mytilus californianus TaxID=6549 RepID=UPI002245A6BF|nr:serine/threonine-protein phosphatase 6 regulatory ankyrin repeat subunit A-like [Mytilus californianus]